MCPEAHFSPEKLIADIRAARETYGRCVVAMSEGVQTEDGTPLAESLIPEERKERDAHGNLQLSGGDLGLALQARDHAPPSRRCGRGSTPSATCRAASPG